MARARVLVPVVALMLGACASGVRPRAPALQGRAACAGDICAPEPEDVRAGGILFEYWLGESDEVKAHLSDISNRSKLFGDLIQHYRSLFAEMELAQREGVELLRLGDREAAWARLDALWMALPVVALQISYVAMASHAEDGGMVSAHWVTILGDMSRRTAPLLEAALGNGFDRRRMQGAARALRGEVVLLRENLPKIQESYARGARWTRTALFVANGVTLAIAAYDAVALLKGGMAAGRRGIPMRFPALAGAGGTGAIVVLPVEVLESLRELVRIGAISAATLSIGMSLMSGKPEVVPEREGLSTSPPIGVSVSAGKNFKEHFITKRPLLEKALGIKIGKLKDGGGDEFLKVLTDGTRNGTFKFVGRGTLKKGTEVMNIYRGRGLTLVTKTSGEWVTLLETGAGLDLAIIMVP